MKKYIVCYCFVYLCILISSCRSKIDTDAINNLVRLDSTFTQDSTTYKYFYEGNKIKYLNRYFLNDPNYPEKLTGRIEYYYTGDKITEKRRYFIPSGNTLTSTLKFSYNSLGKITEISMIKPISPDTIRLRFEYTADKISKATFFNSELVFIYDNNDNITSALLDNQLYTFTTNNKLNPFIANNFFLTEYNLSSLEFFSLLNLPAFFNKYEVTGVKLAGSLYRTYNIKTDNNNNITSFISNWGYQFFYK